MKPVSIYRNTASGLAFTVLEQFTQSRNWKLVSPRGMPIREIRNVTLHLEDTTKCAVWLPGRKLNYPFMFAEFLWMFSGENSVDMISHYCKEISRFSDDGKTFFGAYGPRWNDAIPYVLELIKRDPDTRQAVIEVWRREVYEMEFKTKDVPCTLTMQYFLRDNRLEATVVMRSSDAWLGLPYDLFNFAMLQRVVARSLKRVPGPLTLFIGSAHLYERDLGNAQEIVKRGDTNIWKNVVIAPPPKWEDTELAELEGAIRNGRALEVGDKISASIHYAMLTMLDYRNHKDKSRVADSLRELLDESE